MSNLTRLRFELHRPPAPETNALLIDHWQTGQYLTCLLIKLGRDYFIKNFYLLFYQFWPKSNPKVNAYPTPILTLKTADEKCMDEFCAFSF